MAYLMIFVFVFALSGAQTQLAPECTVLTKRVDEPCCKAGCLIKVFGLDKVAKDCASELKVDEQALLAMENDTDSTPGCMIECILNKGKLLTSDLALNAAAIKETVSKSLIGPWNNVGAKVSEECLKAAVGKIPKDAKCKSGSEQFMRCMNRGLFLECPKENWTDSIECKAQRELLEKCPDSMPPLPKRLD